MKNEQWQFPPMEMNSPINEQRFWLKIKLNPERKI